MIQRIANYIRAGYSGLSIVSHEEGRVEEALVAAIAKCNLTRPKNDKNNPQFRLFIWSLTQGLVDAKEGKRWVKVGNKLKEVEGAVDAGSEGPGTLLDYMAVADDYSVFLCLDFHMFLEDKNPFILRGLRDTLKIGRSKNKCLIELGCRLVLPPELEKEITVLDFTLPGPDELGAALDALVDGNKIAAKDVDDRDGLIAAASGLTLLEADQAFGLSMAERGRVSREVVFREKCQAVRKNGLLEVVETKVTLADIGGAETLKAWLAERQKAFGPEAKAYGLPAPKGMLAVGQPGTGKSLSAKALHSVFDIPLLRLDAGKLFGSLVGQSEGNWRTVIATARAMSPCILWIDEVDGAMSGGANSGQTDGGTTARVIKSMLQDIDASEGVFFALTANDIDNLPAPLLRRMDEVWNFELPNEVEREGIWRIQLKKHKRDAAKFEMPMLVAKSEGYAGAEIEKMVTQMLYRGFAEGREPTTADGVAIMATFRPLSVTMAKDIADRRSRLEGRARLAGGTVPAVAAVAQKPIRRIATAGAN